MTPRAVLFDVDGTLIHAHRVARGALAGAFAEVFSLDADDVHASMDRVLFAGCTDRRIFRDVAEGLGLTLDGRRAAVEAGYVARLETAQAARPATVLPGVVPLLDALRARPDREIGLLTGNLREGARIKLGSCGLWDYFDLGGFADDGQERADIARAAHARMQERLGEALPARRVAVVGDTERDVRAARDCGFVSVAVGNGFGSRDALLRSEPDVFLEDLRDMTWFLDDWT